MQNNEEHKTIEGPIHWTFPHVLAFLGTPKSERPDIIKAYFVSTWLIWGPIFAPTGFRRGPQNEHF